MKHSTDVKLRAVRRYLRGGIVYTVVGFYNGKRINSALGNLPPTVYEGEMAAREPIVVPKIT
jgi:hypothetical protein